MTGYHFCGATLRDGRPIPADGEWLVHEGDVVPCESGLHMSIEPFDALHFAPGALLCKVELDGDVVPHGDPVDKYVGRKRMILARFDATQLLRRFAADQALSVKHLWEMPPIVKEYLTTLDEANRDAALDAAWAAARAAAWDAAPAAARDAAWAAARAAAWDAAPAAARDAAWAAAWDAAWAAAWDAAWDAARKEFNNRVYAAFEEAACNTKPTSSD